MHPYGYSIACALLLAGCAGAPRENAFMEVQHQVSARDDITVQWRQDAAAQAAADAEIKRLLAQPLGQAEAVQLALLGNRRLQAEYERLGLAQADLMQAGLLSNPSFGWSRQEGGDITKTVWGIEFDVLGLLLRAPRLDIEQQRLRHVQLSVAQAVLQHARATRKAWVEAVAAQQDADFMARIAELAAVESELGRRQRDAGNLSRRDALRQQAFHQENLMALARAKQLAAGARERLARLLGIDAGEWRLPERLPPLPAALPALENLEAQGLRQRIDLQLAQQEAETLAAGLKLTRDARWINLFDLGVETEKSTGERRITGPTLRIELPVFDQGQARISRQEALYRQSEAHLYALAVEARSEIREGADTVRTQYAVARDVRDRLLPLRRGIVEESTLHYNGMLIGVYELLADARLQIEAVQTDIAATRDFWLALADLQMTAGGKLPEWPASEAPKGAAENQKPINHGEHGGH